MYSLIKLRNIFVAVEVHISLLMDIFTYEITM